MQDLPNSISTINKRLRPLGEFDVDRKARIIANVIAAQMLPESALRGGTSLKIKYGDSLTRASSDLDVALASERDAFIEEYKQNLSVGWNGFTGVLTPSNQKSNPIGVPQTYITETWNLKLKYKGGEWLKQEIDIGHDEIGDTQEAVYEESSEIWGWFAICGLPLPSPVRVIRVDHQIAQKIHALASDPRERIHDLVDLQVIFKNQSIDLLVTASTCRKLFTSRGTTAWPPRLGNQEGQLAEYESFLEGTNAIQDVSEAVVWFNELVENLESST